MLLAAARNQPLAGEVPLAVFQICSSIRSRVVKLGGGRVITLHVSIDLSNDGGFPSTSGGIDNFNYMVEKMSGLDCAKINLARLGEVDSVTVDGVKITFGETLGPLSLRTNSGILLTLSSLQSHWPVSESWMSYLGWANDLGPSFGGGFETTLKTVIYPIGMMPNDSYWHPGRGVLAHALRNYSVFRVKRIDFIPFDLGKYAAYFMQHASQFTDTPVTVNQGAYNSFMKFALVGYSRIGLCAGQTDFINPYNEKSRFPLPLPLMESGVAVATYRETMRLPYVFQYQLPVSATDIASNQRFNIGGTNVVADITGSFVASGQFADESSVSSNWGVYGADDSIAATVTSRIFGYTTTLSVTALTTAQPNNVFGEHSVDCPTAKAASDSVVGSISIVDVVNKSAWTVLSGSNNSISYDGVLATEAKGVLNDASQVSFFTNLCLPHDCLFTNLSGTGTQKLPYSYSPVTGRDNTSLAARELFNVYTNSFIQHTQYRRTAELEILECLIKNAGGAGSILRKLIGPVAGVAKVVAAATGFGATVPIITAGENLLMNSFGNSGKKGKKNQSTKTKRAGRAGNINAPQGGVVSNGKDKPRAQPGKQQNARRSRVALKRR
jgi:hypothetical protein